MIGRTLDRMLNFVQLIGLGLGGSDSEIFRLARGIRKSVLPIQPMAYNMPDGKLILVEDHVYWNEYSSYSGEIKRVLAKAFEKRKRVKVGETFVLPNMREEETGMGATRPVSYEVKRTSDDTVEVRSFSGHERYPGLERYVISSSRDSLIKFDESGLKPFHYKMVLF